MNHRLREGIFLCAPRDVATVMGVHF